MKSTLLSLFFCAFGLIACEPSDLGDICSLKPGPDAASGDVGETNSEEVVFPATERKDPRCESFSCISTQVRADYCSQKCNGDGNCPDGFICQELQPVGPLAGVRFCVLGKTCTPNVTNSCPQQTMECKTVVTSDPEKPLYFCDQRAPRDKNAK